MADVEIVALAEALCQRFAEAQGWRVVSGNFRDHRHGGLRAHPRRRDIWRLAVIAFEQLHQTPLDEAADNLEDDEQVARYAALPTDAAAGI